jgi:CubicO group peptidase (beta-lactamase class C family)
MTISPTLAGIGLLALTAMTGQPPRNQQPPDLAAAIKDSIGVWRNRTHPIGLVVGVLSHGKPIYVGTFGTRRLAFDSAITRRTIFHLASVTKPFVATAVVQLMEQGKVALDSPVVKYLPYFRVKDPQSAKITVLQLLNHSSGMKDVTDYRWDHPEYDAGSLERYVRGLADSTLRSPPGEKWAYSNIGFEILADLIAKVSGEPFEDYIQRHILTPLGMTHSTLLMTDVDSANLAVGHRRSGPGPAGFSIAAHYPYNRRHAASSTLHSNVDDMLRWALANVQRGELEGHRILPAKSYDRLWTVTFDQTAQVTEQAKRAGIPMPFTSIGTGLSWQVARQDGHLVVSHGGGDTGFRSYILLSPGDSSGVVLMMNDEGPNPSELPRTILKMLWRADRS